MHDDPEIELSIYIKPQVLSILFLCRTNTRDIVLRNTNVIQELQTSQSESYVKDQRSRTTSNKYVNRTLNPIRLIQIISTLPGRGS